MNYYLSSRNIYKCSNCYKQFSVIQGTIFEKSKIPLTKWFLAIYIFTTKKRGISSYQLSKWLGVKQQTAWFVLQRLREALKEENSIILNGMVEADETFIGPRVDRDTRLQREQKRHYEEQEAIHGVRRNKARSLRGFPVKNGRKKGSTKEVLEQKRLEKEAKGKRIPYEKHIIVLGITEQNGKIVLKKLGNSRASINRENINPHLKTHIASDSIFITDQSHAYNDAKNLFLEHRTVNHDEGYVINGVHINTIENIWNHLKRTIDGTYFHFSKYHFNRYLDEHTYRWNKRDYSEQFIFDSFIPLIAGKRITYSELIRKNLDKFAA
ncbi:MAG: IS1595 family transposase [Bacteroidia bacterium]|jgi:3-methyladenine DNA glycosylase AlkC